MTEALNLTIVAAIISTIRRALFLQDVPIGLETRFAEDLSLDSLDAVEVLLALEETFRMDFPLDVREAFRTVTDVAAYLSRRYFRDAAEVGFSRAA